MLLTKNNIINLHNIALAPKCNFNFILRNQRYKSKIGYFDNLIIMMLIINNKVVIEIIKEQNFFKFDSKYS